MPTILSAKRIIVDYYLGREWGRDLIGRNSRSHEQKDLSSCMLLRLHYESLIMKHTPPPFFFPERCLFLSARCTENPVGCSDSDIMSPASHVSVKQRMLQSLMSLWKATLAQISSTLLSRDWTMARSILGSSERCAHLRSLTRRQLRLPLLRRHCFGSPTGIRSIVTGGGPNRGSASGKSYNWS